MLIISVASWFIISRLWIIFLTHRSFNKRRILHFNVAASLLGDIYKKNKYKRKVASPKLLVK